MLPTPFYHDSHVTLYCADAAEVLPFLSADLLVIDPPYGNDYQSNRRTALLPKIKNDLPSDAAGVMTDIEMAIRRIGRGRHAYICGKLDTSKLPLGGVVDLVWDKELLGMGDLQSTWGPAHEVITFGVYELSAANRAKGYGNLAARIRKGSVIRAQRPTGGAVVRHPNEKPVALYRQLIESSSVMGEVVLDCFCGSGSCLVAARIEGRRSIGVDNNEANCRTAVERLRALAPLDSLISAA